MTDASHLQSHAQQPKVQAPSDPRRASAAVEQTGRSSLLGKLLAIVGAIAAVVYLSNPTLGWFELLPDNLPGIGNVDEVFFSFLLIACLRKLGIDILPLMRGGFPRRAHPQEAAEQDGNSRK